MKFLKYLIKISILSVIAGCIYDFIYNDNIPIEYNLTVLKIYILGIIVGMISGKLN